MTETAYDQIGVGYGQQRQADSRIAARLHAALEDARTVLNVGAGTGSYEPVDREVTAVEPSATMISQRPPGSAPAIQASAESLPFEDNSFDAVMAIFSDHHWNDRACGMRELLRVARRRVAVLNADPGLADRFWLTRDYLPGFLALAPARYGQPGYWQQELGELLGGVKVHPIAVPHDCSDGFYQAFWRRPRAYLAQETRNGTSVFQRLPATEVQGAIEQLGADLDSGRWQHRYSTLSEVSELDVGIRLVVHEVRM